MKRAVLDPSYFQGAVSFEERQGALRPWRVLQEERVLIEAHGELADKAGQSAGVRIRFLTDSPFVELEMTSDSEMDPAHLYDLVGEGRRLDSVQADPESRIIRFDSLPGGRQQILEIWLPVGGKSFYRALHTAEGSVLEPAPDPRLRWVTYGSSITHCHASTSPSRAWPAIAARAADLHLTCLGFAGQCHLDSMMGRLIRDLPADLITLKLGINVYGGGSLNQRSFVPAVIGLVRLIREKHPETPIGLITAIHGCEREIEHNAAGLTLENYREELRKAGAALKAFGDPHLFLFEGTELLGAGETDLLPDRLHPNGEGYERMGARAAEKILPVLLRDLEKIRG